MNAESAALELHHIHGLALESAGNGVLYVATHAGLVKGTNGKDWQFVGSERSDFMGFTVHPAVPGLIVASGHPGERSRVPNPRGVIVSRDGGVTWRPLALEGVADFHALTLSPADGDTLYGWNVGLNPGFYRVSLRDGSFARLEARGLADVFALAAHPTRRETVLAATRSGLLISRDGGRSWEHLAPSLRDVPVTAVGFRPAKPEILLAYGARPDLGLVRSGDGGRTWTALGLFLGRNDAVSHIALDTASEAMYVATFGSDVLYSSAGAGQWQPLIQRGRPVAGR